MPWPSVANAFWSAIAPIEGVVRDPYLDRDGWVTTAMGYKVDEGTGSAPASMLSLPWHYFTPMPIGAPETNDIIAASPMATQAQIRDGWSRVKAAQDKKGIGGGQAFWRSLTNLRLDDAGMRNATTRWIAGAEPTLRLSFPGYDTTQADGQMTILNMAYGMGSAFVPAKGFHMFAATMNANPPNFDEAAAQSTFQPDDNDAIHAHNELSKFLLANAKRWQSSNVPASVLWWPNTYPPGGGGGSGPGGGGSTAIAAWHAPPPRRHWLRTLLALGLGGLGVFAVRGFVRRDPWTRRPAAYVRGLVRREGRLEARIDRELGVGGGKT
jgi:hypothetical protein